LTVFDSKLQLAITFAYKLHFRRETTQNAQHKKFDNFVAARPPEHSEFPKESGKVKFLASEVLDPEISADLHLYLAFELFLFSCCAAP
jgi:hypothetical protein